MLSYIYKGKVSYLNLYVELEDKSKVSIEVNTNSSDYINDRNFYFLAKGMANDMNSGETYFYFKYHLHYLLMKYIIYTNLIKILDLYF